ncbi:MAG: hypothetical protein WBA63_12555 [Thermomicrobiales bacterium]
MAALTIHNLDDEVKAKLRARAAKHGRSMEAEAREILTAAVDSPSGARSLLSQDAEHPSAALPGDIADQKILAMLDAMGIEDARKELSPEQMKELYRLVHEAKERDENVGEAIARVFSELGGVTLTSPRSGREARWAEFPE